jgi:hypothetical protein
MWKVYPLLPNEGILSIKGICTDGVDKLWITLSENEGLRIGFIEGILTYELWGRNEGIVDIMGCFCG